MYYKNKSITIETTNRCAAKCVMCPREKMIQPLESMSNELYEKIVRDAFKEKIETIDLCGYGDVFLDKGIQEKVKFTKELNPNCSIFISTTGNAMGERFYDTIFNYVDILKFSIYGLTKDVYEIVMGGIKFEKSMNNINNFLEFKKKTNDKKVYTMGNFINIKENKHQMKQWIDTWQPKLDEVYVWEPHNYTDGRNYRDISGKKQETCGRPIDGPLNIAVNGKAHVCCFDFNKHMVVGDTNTMSLDEIMKSKELSDIIEKHKKNDFSELPLCATCDQTVHDDTVLIYKSNPERQVGMESSTMYKWK
tara:strand:- start:133 stop:1050 length:918 start_codon:yes stop_codon:yes gene_type:complete